MDSITIIQKLENVSKRTLQDLDGYSEMQLNFKLNSNSWSIAQVLDHLININESYYPILDALHQGTYKLPWYASKGFFADYLGNFILKSVNPDRKKKIKTFPIWEPSYSNITEDIVSQFIQHQESLIRRIQDSEAFIHSNTIICSPASNIIFYKLEKAFEIIATHEERHLIQIQEIVSIIKNTK